jgi:hypothetical protein
VARDVTAQSSVDKGGKRAMDITDDLEKTPLLPQNLVKHGDISLSIPSFLKKGAACVRNIYVCFYVCAY